MAYNSPLYIKGTKSYTDLDLSFVSHPITKNLSKKFDQDSISQAIKVLLYTHFGEKPFDPTFGSKIRHLMFEQNTRFLQDEIDAEIKRVIYSHEPRIVVSEIRITNKEDENAISIQIFFYFNGLPDPITINILLKRAR